MDVETLRTKFHEFLDGPLTEAEFREALREYSETLRARQRARDCQALEERKWT
jgi:hypothetical protein